MLTKKYGNQYIAKSEKTGKILAHHERMDIVFNKTKNKKDVIISWVPKHGSSYVFRISIGWRKTEFLLDTGAEKTFLSHYLV